MYELDKKDIKKEKSILILMVFTILVLLIGSSYALLTNYDETNEIVTFKTGNLNMSVQADTIDLSGKLPESDESGLLNSEPIIINLTNTGTMNIKGYDLKLVSEDGKESTLSDLHIKYAISLDNGKTYQETSNLGEDNNIIHKGYNLAVGNSKTIYLKIWIDEASGNLALNKIYYGSIQVDLYQEADVPVKVLVEEKMDAVTCNSTIKDTDGIVYFSGTNDCVNYNYVWYSGKLWRITAIYPDGRMKLVTENAMATNLYGENSSYYTDNNNTSWVYQWVNEDFKDTLYNYENILEINHKWDYTRVTSISTKLNGSNVKEGPVGLLNTYEYYQSYQNATNATGYLNINYNYWLLNSYNDSKAWCAYYTGEAQNKGVKLWDAPRSMRPSVVLSKDVFMYGGDGTINNPYTIKGDIEKAVHGVTYLNERISGEFVNFNNSLYRIVEIDNGDIKLNSYNLLKENGSNVQKYLASSLKYGLSTNTQTDDYFDYYLNNTWYNSIPVNYKSMMVKDVYYIQEMGTNNSDSYKSIVCKTASNTISIKNCEKTASTWEGYVGLPRYGELFSAHAEIKAGTNYSIGAIFLINAGHAQYMINTAYGNGNLLSEQNQSVKPSITLNKAVKIISGLGTKDSPFEVSL